MKKCCFYGDINENDIDLSLLCRLYDFFEYLIDKQDVCIFYSASKNTFDNFCEGIINGLKSKYNHIKLIKVVPDAYKAFMNEKDLDDTPFDDVVFAEIDSSFNPCLIRQRYKWIVDNSDFMASCIINYDTLAKELFEYAVLKSVLKGKISIKNLA